MLSGWAQAGKTCDAGCLRCVIDKQRVQFAPFHSHHTCILLHLQIYIIVTARTQPQPNLEMFNMDASQHAIWSMDGHLHRLRECPRRSVLVRRRQQATVKSLRHVSSYFANDESYVFYL